MRETAREEMRSVKSSDAEGGCGCLEVFGTAGKEPEVVF